MECACLEPDCVRPRCRSAFCALHKPRQDAPAPKATSSAGPLAGARQTRLFTFFTPQAAAGGEDIRALPLAARLISVLSALLKSLVPADISAVAGIHDALNADRMLHFVAYLWKSPIALQRLGFLLRRLPGTFTLHRFRACCINVLRFMHNRNTSAESENLGRQGVNRFMGFQGTLERMGIIKSGVGGNRQRTYRLGSLKKPFHLATDSTVLEQMFAATRVSMGAVGSYGEMSSYLDDWDTALDQMPGCFLLGGTYVRPHVCRKAALSAADFSDTTKFQTSQLSCSLLRRMSADQGGFLDSVSHVPLVRLHELLQVHPVYWTIWACLLHEAVDKLIYPGDDVVAFLTASLPQLLRLRDEYRERHQLNPCPYVLFSMLDGVQRKPVQRGA